MFEHQDVCWIRWFQIVFVMAFLPSLSFAAALSFQIAK